MRCGRFQVNILLNVGVWQLWVIFTVLLCRPNQTGQNCTFDLPVSEQFRRVFDNVQQGADEGALFAQISRVLATAGVRQLRHQLRSMTVVLHHDSQAATARPECEQ